MATEYSAAEHNGGSRVRAETDRAAAVRARADKINAHPEAPQTLRDLATMSPTVRDLHVGGG
jgi:hypothetical protein